MTRYNPVISRDCSATEAAQKEPDWLSTFIENLQKSAVKSKREDYSLFEQINNTIANKSEFATVEEKVKSLSERVGLTKFMEVKAQLESSEPAKSVEIFSSIPELKVFIDNYVAARPGTSVDGVLHDAIKINQIKKKLPDNGEFPEDVKRYISNKIVEEAKGVRDGNSDTSQLGKVDVSVDKNTVDDPLGSCMPARI